ncbi:MAG: response regulator [Magnetococcales bacterium]|nr:response regulator [Magnetococcales bacterium]
MPKILIVDDNETEIRRPLVRQLGRVFGPEEILEAANGHDALSMLYAQEGEIGVIILDIMMPVMDGIAACRAIRGNPDHEGVYIAMLTGRDGGLPEGLEVGADVYLRKPCDADELIAVVKKGFLEFEKHRQHMIEQADLANRLQQSELEKRDLQQQNNYVEMPFLSDEPHNWLDVLDQSD